MAAINNPRTGYVNRGDVVTGTYSDADLTIVELKIIDRIESIASCMATCHKYCDALLGSAVGQADDNRPPTPGFIDRIEQRLIDIEKETMELCERMDIVARRLA